MEEDVIIMASAQFNYCVGLIPDQSVFGKRPLKYTNSLSLLKSFLAAENAKYVGLFSQDGIEYPEYAVVKMSQSQEKKLQDLCLSALFDSKQTPFVERIEGLFFNISREKGMTISTVESSINRRIYQQLPL